MSHPQRPHEALSDLSAGALNGVDQLWKFQIRKEQEAMLQRVEKVEALAKAAEALPAKLEKRCNDDADLIAALATKYNKVKDACERFQEESEGWQREVLSLGDRLRTLGMQFEASKAAIERLERLRADAIQGASTSQEQEQLIKEGLALQRTQIEDGNREARPQHFNTNDLIDSSSTRTKGIPARTSAATAKSVLPNTPNPSHLHSENSVAQQMKVTPANDAGSSAIPASDGTRKQTRRPANRKPNQTAPPKVHATRGKRAAPASSKIPAPKSSTTKSTRFYQGTGSIATYYSSTAKMYANLPAAESESETEFVSAFIDGITSQNDQYALIAELKRLHPFKTMRGGKVQFQCQWEDVEEGLVKAGLLGERDGDDDSQDRRMKRRRLGDIDFL